MKSIKSVQNVLGRIPDINCGGCGISALAMYRWLKDNDKLVGDESFTYLYVSYDSSFTENDSILKEKKNHKLKSASHIMLFHNGRLIDSDGNAVQNRYINRHNKITEDSLLYSINFSCWNDDFDRKEYVPFIEQKLGVELSDVKIKHN